MKSNIKTHITGIMHNAIAGLMVMFLVFIASLFTPIWGHIGKVLSATIPLWICFSTLGVFWIIFEFRLRCSIERIPKTLPSAGPDQDPYIDSIKNEDSDRQTKTIYQLTKSEAHQNAYIIILERRLKEKGLPVPPQPPIAPEAIIG